MGIYKMYKVEKLRHCGVVFVVRCGVKMKTGPALGCLGFNPGEWQLKIFFCFLNFCF